MPRARRANAAVVRAAAAGAAAVVPGLDALAISLCGPLIDDVLEPRELGPLPGIAAAYIVLTLAVGVLGFGRRYLSAWVTEQSLFALRMRVFEHVQLVPSLQIDQHRLGGLITRLSDDVEEVSDTVSVGLEVAGILAVIAVDAHELVAGRL